MNHLNNEIIELKNSIETNEKYINLMDYVKNFYDETLNNEIQNQENINQILSNREKILTVINKKTPRELLEMQQNVIKTIRYAVCDITKEDRDEKNAYGNDVPYTVATFTSKLKTLDEEFNTFDEEVNITRGGLETRILDDKFYKLVENLLEDKTQKEIADMVAQTKSLIKQKEQELADIKKRIEKASLSKLKINAKKINKLKEQKIKCEQLINTYKENVKAEQILDPNSNLRKAMETVYKAGKEYDAKFKSDEYVEKFKQMIKENDNILVDAYTEANKYDDLLELQTKILNLTLALNGDNLYEIKRFCGYYFTITEPSKNTMEYLKNQIENSKQFNDLFNDSNFCKDFKMYMKKTSPKERLGRNAKPIEVLKEEISVGLYNKINERIWTNYNQASYAKQPNDASKDMTDEK